MANKKVTLYIRIKHEGKRIPCKPVYAAKGRLKPLYAEGHGHHPEGEYYLRYVVGGKPKWEAVGNDAYVALDRLTERQDQLRKWVREGPILELVSEVPAARVTVESAISMYLTTGKAAEKDWRKHTLQCYTLALKLFRESCKKTFLEEIDGDDERHSQGSQPQRRDHAGAAERGRLQRQACGARQASPPAACQ